MARRAVHYVTGSPLMIALRWELATPFPPPFDPFPTRKDRAMRGASVRGLPGTSARDSRSVMLA